MVRTKGHTLLRFVGRWALRLVMGVLVVLATILLVAAFRARRFPDLEAWHANGPEGEFRAHDYHQNFSLDDYLKLEDRLFEALKSYAIDPDQLAGRSKYNRFVHGGSLNPAAFTPNWNRTFERAPAQIRGGVLLLHGLSDSPYSMRTLVNTFHARGFHVVALRLPGHGTIPGGLLETSWQDWVAAVKVAAKHVEAAPDSTATLRSVRLLERRCPRPASRAHRNARG